MKSYSVTIQMKATEQYFPVVLFVMLYKVVLKFESMDEILACVAGARRGKGIGEIRCVLECKGSAQEGS